MGFLGAIVEVVSAPITIGAKVSKDLTGKNGDDEQMLSVLTCGGSSVVKGLGKAFEKACEKLEE